MSVKYLESEEELREVVNRLCKVLPRFCPRLESTLMYARYFMKGGEWIYYIGASAPFGDNDTMFFGYSTHEPAWMQWTFSQMGSNFKYPNLFMKDALEILPVPLPVSELLKLSLVAPE